MKNNIPIIILAGGLGTRLSEETDQRPKPMVAIGEHPIIWHLMKIYAVQGFGNFKIATGYKHEVIDEWVSKNNSAKSWGFKCEVKAIYTGDETQTGGRIKEVMKQVPSDRYMMTYGDGLANVNLQNLLNFHTSHGKLATVTSVRPPARFGQITSLDGKVIHFGEKNQADAGWINGGFFVLENEVSNYIKSPLEPFERDPLSELVADSQLMTIQHEGFWQPMDTLRERHILEEFAVEPLPIWLKFE
jgi:glucose-1-phosphate cytidylyltransferase